MSVGERSRQNSQSLKRTMTPAICILAFSPIRQDGRVLRQIRYLSKEYPLTVIGYGSRPEEIESPQVVWHSLDQDRVIAGEGGKPPGQRTGLLPVLQKRLEGCWTQIRRAGVRTLLFLGRLHPWFYEFWFWHHRYHEAALRLALKSGGNAFHANDWEALPVAAEAVRTNGGRIVFDAHEYGPLELEGRVSWRLFFKPAVLYFVGKYCHMIDRTVTVSTMIAERFRSEFGLDAQVILNTPEREQAWSVTREDRMVHLIHHGGANRSRKLETLIDVVARCDHRFQLHFMLLENDSQYLRFLKNMADRQAPGRVIFHPPVRPSDVVRFISRFDIGVYLLPPDSFNNRAALPNKFFDFIAAGLAVCIGPSPAMAEMVQRLSNGCVAPSFACRDLAAVLMHLVPGELERMKQASREASQGLNAHTEMAKLVALYRSLLRTNPAESIGRNSF
jgi:hypothetical protein